MRVDEIRALIPEQAAEATTPREVVKKALGLHGNQIAKLEQRAGITPTRAWNSRMYYTDEQVKALIDAYATPGEVRNIKYIRGARRGATPVATPPANVSRTRARAAR